MKRTVFLSFAKAHCVSVYRYILVIDDTSQPALRFLSVYWVLWQYIREPEPPVPLCFQGGEGTWAQEASCVDSSSCETAVTRWRWSVTLGSKWGIGKIPSSSAVHPSGGPGWHRGRELVPPCSHENRPPAGGGSWIRATVTEMSWLIHTHFISWTKGVLHSSVSPKPYTYSAGFLGKRPGCRIALVRPHSPCQPQAVAQSDKVTGTKRPRCSLMGLLVWGTVI